MVWLLHIKNTNNNFSGSSKFPDYFRICFFLHWFVELGSQQVHAFISLFNLWKSLFPSYPLLGIYLWKKFHLMKLSHTLIHWMKNVCVLPSVFLFVYASVKPPECGLDINRQRKTWSTEIRTWDLFPVPPTMSVLFKCFYNE